MAARTDERTRRNPRRLNAGAVAHALELLRRRAPMLDRGLAVLVAVLLLAAAFPPAAQAQGGLIDHFPDPLDAFDAAGDAVKGGAVSAFGAILGALFGGIQAKITTELITWVVAIPNFAGGNIEQLASTLNAIAFGLLGVVMTFAVARFWLSGLSSSGAGGAEAVDGFTRTVAAALFILAWPLLFAQAVALSNAATSAVMHSGSLTDDLTRLFGAAVIADFTLGHVGWIINVILALAGTLLLLALVLMKVTLSAATAVLFVAMPIAVILWPISETSWVARTAARGMFVCLLIPLVWVVLFATAAAISVDALSFKGGGGVLDAVIIKPLTAIALLYLAVTAPKALMKAAMLGAKAPGGGFVSRTASYMAGRQASAAIGQHLPAALGATRPPDPETPTRGGPAPAAPTGDAIGGARGDANAHGAATVPGAVGVGAPAQAAAAGNAPSAAGPGKAATRVAPAAPAPGTGAAAGATRAAAGAAEVTKAAAGTTGAPGAGDPKRPYSQQAHDDELSRAQRRQTTNPPTAGDVSSAMARLTPDQQQAARRTAADPGASGDKPMRGFAYMASHEPASDEQRDAFRTLAAAPPAAREHGINQTPAVPAAAATPTSADAGGGARPSAPGPVHGDLSGSERGTEATPVPDTGLGSVGEAGGFGRSDAAAPSPPHRPTQTEPATTDSPATPPRPPEADESPFAGY